MDYSQFKQHLAKGIPYSLYLIYGEEDYLSNKALNLLKNKAVEQQGADLFLTAFNGAECTAGEILNAANSMPLLGGQALVIVKEAQSLKSKTQDQLVECFSKSPPFNLLVFVAKGKVDKRKKFFAGFKNYGQQVSCSYLNHRECLDWLHNQAQAMGCKLSPKAADYLLEVGGRDLQLLANELNKVITFVGEKRFVDLPDLEEILGRQPSHSIFNLTDALGQKDLKTALVILNQLLASGQFPLVILSMMARQLRKIAQIKELSAQGIPANQVGRRLGIPPFLQDNLIKQSGNFTLEQVKQALGRLLETDLQLKSSSQPAHILLEALLIELCV